MKHSALVKMALVFLGALVVPRAMADAFSWNNSGSGSAYWGNPNKWTKTAGSGSQTVPSIAGDTVSIPESTSITISVADAGGAASTFVVDKISRAQVTQSCSFSNPTTGLSKLIFDSAGGASTTSSISNSMSGGDKRLRLPSAVVLELNNHLLVSHGSNLNPPTVFDGVLQDGTAPSPSFILTGGNVRAALNAINTFSGGVAVVPNQNRSGANTNVTRLYVNGGADATGSATGTGATTVTGRSVGDDKNTASIMGIGNVGPVGRTGTTLTVSGGSSVSLGLVEPAGLLLNSGGHTNTIGTLTVNGDVVFGSHSQLVVQYDNTLSDVLRVNGTLNVAAADTYLTVARHTATASGTLATTYELGHYTVGGLTGRFATETLPAELTDAGYRVFYDQPSSLGAGYAAITLAKQPAGTLITIR